jgi:hypothetical protein
LQFSESNKKQVQSADCGNVTAPDNLATKAKPSRRRRELLDIQRKRGIFLAANKLARSQTG